MYFFNKGINSNVYYRWSKEFLEAGKKRLSGDTAREATSDEVKQLRSEATALKATLAELLMENRLLKKAGAEMGRAVYEIFDLREIRNYPSGRVIQPTRQTDAQTA